MEDWNNRITSYAYDANNCLTATQRPDGSIETRSYDDAGRLIQIIDQDQNDNILTQFDFTYNAAGNITIETNNFPEVALPEENTTMTYTTDNRLATFNGETVEYDTDGNMTGGPLNGEIVDYTFDSRNRLTAVGNTAYTYDAENNRISVADAVYHDSYVINPNANLSQVLLKTDSQGSQTFYVYGLGLIGEETGTDYKVYHYDLRGSTVMLTDTTGVATDTYQYGPYGELIDHTGTSTTPFLYNGRDGVMTDGNGLYYMRARYYEVGSRRFVSRDSLLGNINNSASLDRYTFVLGKPLMSLDPLGLWCQDVHYTDTYYWAKEVGFEYWEAELIASADKNIDFYLKSHPLPKALLGDQSMHFDRDPSENDSRLINSDQYFQLAVNDLENLDITWALINLGRGLHPLQDIDAHMQYGSDIEGDIWVKHNNISIHFDDTGWDHSGNDYSEGWYSLGNRQSSRYLNTKVRSIDYLTRFFDIYRSYKRCD